MLQDYLASEEGKALLDAIQEAPGYSQEEISGALISLPKLDFYLPFEEHRESWDGSTAPMVLATIDPDTRPVPGFRSSGAPTFYPGNPAPAPAVAVLALHRAEPKVPSDRDGDHHSFDTAAVLRPLHGVASGYTYLQYVKHTAYMNDAVGSSEIELRFDFYDADGTVHAATSWGPFGLYQGGDADDIHYALFTDIIPDSSMVYIRVRYYEDDSDEGGTNDWIGTEYAYWDDNDLTISTYDHSSPTSMVGQVKLAWVAVDPQELTSLSIPGIQLEESEQVEVTVKAYDQYGYHIPFDDPSHDDVDITSHSIANTGFATVGSATEGNNATMTVTGVSDGTTYLRVTANLRGSVTDSGGVTVTNPCSPPFCPESISRPLIPVVERLLRAVAKDQ